jgi:serine/threonine protein kinase
MNAAMKTPPAEKLRGYLLGTLPLEENNEVSSWMQSQPQVATAFSTISAQDAITLALAEPSCLACDPSAVEEVIQKVRLATKGGASRPLAKELGDPDRTQPLSNLMRDATPAAPIKFGVYRVIEELGKGGQGVVHRVMDEKLQREAAVKVLVPQSSDNQQHRERFLREARIAAAIRSDHIVTIYQVGEEDGRLYLAMELLKGSTLEDWLRAKQGPVTLPEIARITREMLTGLAAAHEKRLIHRDIKPGNLWIEQGSGRLKIMDFGLGREVSDRNGVTQSGSVVGTPAYMAPEQATGQHVDARADMFSVGIVLYRMIAGCSPYQRDDVLATLAALANVEPAPLKGIPPELNRFIARLTSKAASGRPANAQAALQEWAAIEPKVLAQRAKNDGRRTRWQIAAGWLATAALIFGAVTLIIQYKNGKWDVKLKIVPNPPDTPSSPEDKQKGEQPTPPPTPVIGGRIQVGSRVRVTKYTSSFLDASGGNFVRTVDEGERGVVDEVPESSNYCRVRWKDNSESWVSQGCLAVE